MLDQIKQIERDADTELAAAVNADDLTKFSAKYLGKQGAIPALKPLLKNVAKDAKAAVGKAINELEAKFNAALAARRDALGSAAATPPPRLPGVDITEPGLPPRMGRTHVITQTIDELIDVFGRMGFDVATGPEVEDEYHNFVALNIPESHPARDPLDNFYLDADPAPGKARLLRSQTSTIQIRVMEKAKPPIRVVAMGRVYRPDEHDATHYSMFHQVEGLYVDKNVSMVDLKTTLMQFVRAYFGPDAKIRLRPSFFPFTEPSAEMDVWMNRGGKWQWVEIGGCGMVDPAVFQAVGYDPEVWSGFAFGLGIERLAMRKYGISDIRWLFENDVRFLRQF